MEQAIRRQNVYELIAEQLIMQISERRLRPGDVLPPERELTQLYHVGRSSVREALRMLESKGLIEPAGNGSFVVADFRNPLNDSLSLLLTLDEASMRDIYELRRILECEAAALAAQRRVDKHVARMDEAIKEMSGGLAASDADQYIDADLNFHLAIAEATGNRLMLHSMHAIRELLRRALKSVYLVPGSPERSLVQHHSIRNAIAAGDGARARDEMERHLVRVEADVRALLATGVEADGRGAR